MHESVKSSDLCQLFRNKITDRQLQRKRKADREREEKIRHFTALLADGSITVPYFLGVMSKKDVLLPIGTYKI